jgi:hypothetical protein
MRIVWPFDWVSAPSINLHSVSSTRNLASKSYEETSASEFIFLFPIESSGLAADTWYVLNISGTASADSFYYTDPIRMYTYSGMTTSPVSATSYVMYDSNNFCGFISVAPTPDTLTSVTVSTSLTTTVLPSATDAHKYYEAPYDVYIHI